MTIDLHLANIDGQQVGLTVLYFPNFATATPAALATGFLHYVQNASEKSLMIFLTPAQQPVYSASVANKDATGFSSSNIQGGHPAQRGFFTSVQSWHSPSMAGLVGDTFGYAGGLVCRSANPFQFRLPHLAVRSGLTAIQGDHHV